MTAITHQTTSQSHAAPAQPTLSAKALLQSDDEALARMLLTHCSECANALMTSLLKGCDSEQPRRGGTACAAHGCMRRHRTRTATCTQHLGMHVHSGHGTLGPQGAQRRRGLLPAGLTTLGRPPAAAADLRPGCAIRSVHRTRRLYRCHSRFALLARVVGGPRRAL